MIAIGLRQAIGALAAIGAVVLPAAPAAGDPGGALISLDGEWFAAAPDGSIFPADLVLVPGSHYTGTLWVQNNSDRAADLRISVSDTTSTSEALIEQLTLQAATPGTDDTSPVALQPGATCTPLLQGELLRAGSVTEVSITLAMSDDVENDHQGATTGTTLMVSLTDPDAPSTAADCTSGGGIPLTPEPRRPGGSGGTGVSGGHADCSTGWGDSPCGIDGRPANPVEDGVDPATGKPGPSAPVDAAAPPELGAGSPVLFPWVAVGVAVLAAGVFFGLRQRKGHRE